MSTSVIEDGLQNISVDRDPRWKLVERIVAAPGFVKSARLSTFLLYIVRETLYGNAEELTEQLIGERVFERPVGYDPRDDNIVRSHASRLRRRLELYFQEEGREETLRLALPRGSYVPVFERAQNHGCESAPATEEAQPQMVVVSGKSLRHWWINILACAVLVLILGAVIVQAVHSGKRHPVLESKGPAHELWSHFFSGNRNTLIVPADSSLVVLKVFTGHTVGISEYASGRYLADIICAKPCDRTLLQTLAAHRYTSTADLKFAVAVTHLSEAAGNRTEIRYARDLQLDDLKQSNLILLGTSEANPWTGLFLSRMNFILHDDRSSGPLEVENREPKPGESSHYAYDIHDPAHGYATVAFLPDLSGGGNVLIVQGFSLADTEAAADFVLNRRSFDALMQPIVSKRATLPHFELLLKTFDVNGIGSPPSLLAYRLYR